MSLLTHFSITAFLLSPLNLLAQQYVDVFPDSIYIQEYADFKGSGIVKINHDLSVERFLPPVLPKGFDLKDFIGGIRAKIRLDSVWISDKHRIYKKPLDAEPNQEWELVKVPSHIAQFQDFEIISDKEAIICGCMFSPDPDAPNSLPPSDMHFVFNYKSGGVTTTIESIDIKAIPYDLFNDDRFGSEAMKISQSYMCRFDSRIVIVGKYSGFVTVLNINDNGKLHNSRKFRVVPEDELPSDPREATNNGSAISWVGPLSGDDVLMCCRMWVVPDKKPSKPVSVECFRKLNLKTGKVTFENTVYRDWPAVRYLTLFEENGELLSAREYMQKCIEQSKKPKSTPTSEQPDKQVDQPPMQFVWQ